MRQSKRHSFLEAICNTAIGYGINLGVQLLAFPSFGIHVTFGQNATIGLVFTGVSIVRGYVVRRVYETYLR